ncbi:hypothetical protein FB451DRAFT_1404318 [Mycena latifolia]|nr:hypothetical protein FB451DRAFT_1404318 [Mycena latifolia]
MKGDHKTAESLAKYPFGQVPVVMSSSTYTILDCCLGIIDCLWQDDDGFILYESRAICRYLAEKYAGQGTPLRPTALKKKALFEQAAKYLGLTVDDAVLAQGLTGLTVTLDVYETILGKQKFIGGNLRLIINFLDDHP